MDDDRTKPDHAGADALNSRRPEPQDAARKDGSVDKDKLRAEIERQKEELRQDGRDLAREREKRG